MNTTRLDGQKDRTYEEWLGRQSIPDGFRKWKHAWNHWDQGNPLGWAIHCFEKRTHGHAERRNSLPRDWHNPNCPAFSDSIATCRQDCGYWKYDGKTRAQRIAELEKIGIPVLDQD